MAIDLKRQSPLGTYLEHWKKASSPTRLHDDGKPVFYPRVVGARHRRYQSGMARVEGPRHRVLRRPSCIFKGEPPLNVALIDIDEGFRMMSRVEDIDRCAGEDRHAREVPCSSGRREAAALSRVHAGGGRQMSASARQRRGRRRRRIRSRASRAGHEPGRPDGAGHDARARRLRA